MEPNSKSLVSRIKLPFGTRKKEKEETESANESEALPKVELRLPQSRPRRKQRMGHGFSQMDWMRLTQQSQSLAGGGRSARAVEITMDEVRRHQTEHDAWMVIRGKVYNVTKYLPYHPGGWDELMRGVGKEASSLFDEFHPWVGIEGMLDKCIVGVLKDGEADDSLWKPVQISQRELVTESCFQIELSGLDSLKTPSFPFHIELQVPSPNGKFQIERQYTPVCNIDSPSVDGRMNLIIRMYSDGLMSRYLCQDAAIGKPCDLSAKLVQSRIEIGDGDSITDTGCNPAVVLKDLEHIVFVVGGTGITPVFQCIQKLENHETSSARISVVHFNRCSRDIPLKEEMKSLANGRVSVTFVLTAEPTTEVGFVGAKLSPMFFSKHPDILNFDKSKAEASVAILCGPPDFEREVKKSLSVIGFGGKQVLRF